MIRRLSHRVPGTLATALLAAAFSLAGGALAPQAALAGFASSGTASASYSTAVMQPPTSLAGTPGCSGVNVANATLTWLATTSTYASGYEVYQSTTSGGPWGSAVATVAGQATLAYTVGGLATNTTYYFVMVAYYDNWTSAYSTQVSVATAAICT